MPPSKILVGQAVRSRRNIVLVVFASCITGNNDRLVYLKYIGQVMLDGFKGDKYLGRGGCLASCQTVGIRLETSRVMTLRWLSGSGKEIYNRRVGCLWSGSGRVDYSVGEADLWPWTRAYVKLLRWLG